MRKHKIYEYVIKIYSEDANRHQKGFEKNQPYKQSPWTQFKIY